MALLSPVCAGTSSAAGGVDAEGPKQWDQRSPEEPAEIHIYIFCASIAAWFAWDCVCCGLLPSCAKSLLAAFNFQVASLTFSCQKDAEEPGKQQLPRESRGGSDRRVFIASFSLQFFHNFMVPGRAAGEAEARLSVTASAEGQSGPTHKVKKDKAA